MLVKLLVVYIKETKNVENSIWCNSQFRCLLFGLISGASMNSAHSLVRAVMSSYYDNILYKYVNIQNIIIDINTIVCINILEK